MTLASWCRVCGADHPQDRGCPGEWRPSGPELPGWKVSVETPGGFVGYGVLLAPTEDRWLARILTFPNVLWTIPGGRATLKFLGRTEREAEAKAVAFIRSHCIGLGYTMRDEIGLVADAAHAVRRPDVMGSPRRYSRRLPIRFGRSRPIVQAETGNLSESGLLVVTEHPMAGGDLVGLLLELEHGKVPLRASVVWNRYSISRGLVPGMGLQLLNPPAMYTRYVDALG